LEVKETALDDQRQVNILIHLTQGNNFVN